MVEWQFKYSYQFLHNLSEKFVGAHMFDNTKTDLGQIRHDGITLHFISQKF